MSTQKPGGPLAATILSGYALHELSDGGQQVMSNINEDTMSKATTGLANEIKKLSQGLCAHHQN